MKTAGIYRIELGNGWFYIGSSVNLKRRKINHKSDLIAARHHNPKMQNVWNKYGVFKFTILEECNNADLLLREQFYLDQYFNDENNLNITPKANSWLGRVHSAETKAKISAASKGRVVSPETRAKLSAAQIGRVAQIGHVVSTETRAKLSAANKGRILSAETRARMSAAKKKMSAETKAKISAAASARWDRRRSQGLLS